MDKLPIYRFIVTEDDEAQLEAVAFVDSPAIEMNWQAFNSQVNIIICKECGHSWDIADGGENPYMCKCGVDNTPSDLEFKEGVSHYTIDGKLYTGDTHKDASGRLMTGATHTSDSKYLYHEDAFQKFESYTDYPKQASENAQIALDYAEKNGWGDCGTDVGKQRANQLAKREPISRDTIARMSAFERQRQNSDRKLGDGCGRLMWLAWGGDAGVEWASRKLEQIDKKSFIKFSADTEKRIISGPLMVADLPIYRRTEDEEYYGVFQKEDIYNLRNKFFKQGKSNLVNEMHNSNKMIDGVYMIESFLIDEARGINAPTGYNLTDGSWFGSYKIDNDEVWNDFIKSGEFKGFSVEGIFNTVKIDEKPQNIIEDIINIIKNINE